MAKVSEAVEVKVVKVMEDREKVSKPYYSLVLIFSSLVWFRIPQEEAHHGGEPQDQLQGDQQEGVREGQEAERGA